MSTDRDATIRASEEANNPLFHLVRSYGRPYWPQFTVGLVAQTLGQLPGRVPALVVGVAFDALFFRSTAYDLPLVPSSWLPETTMGQFWFTVGVVVVAYALGSLLGVLSSVAYGWFNLRLLHDVRTDTYDAMQRLSLGYFDTEQTGEIMSILNNDVENLQSFTKSTLSDVIQLPISVGIAFAFMALLNWQLALVLLFVPVLIALLSRWFASVLEPIWDESRARVGALNSRFENNIGGIATVKAYTAEETEIGRVEASSRRRLEKDLEAAKYGGAAGPSANLVQDLGIVVLLLVGGYWILSGPPAFFTEPFTAGMLITFLVYTRSFVGPMRRVTNIVDSYLNAKASATRIVDLLADPEVIPEADDSVTLERVDGRVEYEDVSFAYEETDDWTLTDVSFAVDPGETIGLVGPTGAGKSTLTKLLFRFYDINGGSIRVEGTDIRECTLESLRRHLGYVGQEPFLFYGTVRENIAYGVTEASDSTVHEAAERAGAHEFVEDLPEGYETIVGERGLTLSGGQRQRIAIARAIVRDPAILVLDEATSHVDNETEAAIQRNLEHLTEDRTTFVIAHRLSTVRNADRILVLDDGEIVERGTHEELLENDSLYANLWKVQVGDVAALPEAFVERTRRRQLGERP